MFLKKLYANGFKSIGKPVEIDLMNDVNVIMGPNGSGKSNFFECIQWVLGGMSAKQLRASSMEDVIFDGGSNWKAADVAEATLIFDNVDRELEIDTDEVAITRKLTRGKGTEYFINHEPAKLKDLTNLFLNKGIGKNNYAITGQNRITEFIMMKPDDIRGVIEEAAGISGFRLKKNELVASIANYDRDLERIDAVINEISRSLKPLKKQIKNAEIYETVKKELDERKLYYYSKKLEEYSTLSELNRSKYSEILNSKESSEVEKNDIELFLEDYATTSVGFAEKLALLESTKDEIEAALSDLGKDKIMAENTLTNLIEKKENMLSNIKNLEESSTVEEEEKKKLFNSITSLSKEISTIKANIESNDSTIATLKETISTIDEFLENNQNENTSFIVDLEKKHKDKEIILERKDTLSSSLENKLSEIKSVTNELSDLKSQVQNNLNNIEEINKRVLLFKDNESQIKAIENVINSSKKSEGRKKRTNEVKSLLSSVNGFHDVLFNIVSYDDKYINAMDTLYGSVLHNFVVEDVKAAESCVSILKKNKIPPANFIIISKLKGHNNKAVSLDNVEKVSDILSYDSKYSNLVNDYFSNTYIAKDSKIAEKTWNDTSQKYRICTLDGTLFAANIIRGGYIQKDSKKLQSDYNKLLDEKKSLLTFNNEVLSNIYELKGKISIISKENEVLSKQINSLKNRLASFESEKFRIESELSSINDKLKSILEEIAHLEEKQSTNISKLNLKQKELVESKENIDELLALRETLIIDMNKKETLLEEQEKNYYVYKNNSQEKIESLKNNVDIVEDQISLAQEQFNSTLIIYNEKASELEDATNEWNLYRTEIEDKRSEKDEKSNKLNELISCIANADNELTKLDFEFEKISNNIASCEESASEIPEETDFVVYDEDMKSIYSAIVSLEKKIKSLGFINTDAISEFKELNSRYEVMAKNKADLEESKLKILTVLQKMQDDMSIKYLECFNSLKDDFSNIFSKLFNGGSAELLMENPSAPLDSGVIIKATPPGKKNKAISLLSGGEKSLAAVSFIFALLKYSPSPVVIFDEIDAALDEINVSLIADYIRENSNVQYVIVSHRKPMMKIAKALYGASMNKGITELISQKL